MGDDVMMYSTVMRHLNLESSRRLPVKQQNIIAQAGSGDKPGRGMADLSRQVQEHIGKGELTFTFSPDKEDLRLISHGAAAHMSLQDFAKSDLFPAAIRDLYLQNVLTAQYSGLDQKTCEEILPALREKLESRGRIIIIENLLPRKAMFLKKIPFDQLGLVATWSEGTSYQQKLTELRLKETPAVEESGLFRGSTPFILELRKK